MSDKFQLRQHNRYQLATIDLSRFYPKQMLIKKMRKNDSNKKVNNPPNLSNLEMHKQFKT